MAIEQKTLFEVTYSEDVIIHVVAANHSDAHKKFLRWCRNDGTEPLTITRIGEVIVEQEGILGEK